MNLLIAMYLFGISGILGITMILQHASGKQDLLSLRNIFLIGFIVFQLTSVGLRMFTQDYNFFKMNDPAAAALEFSTLATAFLFTFFLVYHWGVGSKKLAGLVPDVPENSNPTALISLAIILTAIAVPLRFAFNVPVLGVLANFLGVGAAAMACGLVGWVWAPRLFNPALALFAILFLAVNLLTVMTGAFGRRSIIAVFGCMVWAMYYSHWRYMPTKALLTRLAILSAGPIIFLALYTSVRSAAEHDRSATDHLTQIQTGGNFVSGLAMLLDGQATGPAGLWIIEHYPEDFTPRYFFTATYFFGINAPRIVWKNKPEPLSVLLADQANISGVQQDKIKLSCGIIGVAAAEGGLFAALLYGACGGFFLRFFEQIARNNITSIFVILPIGSALGQILGLARGDTTTFANTYLITTLGSLAIMIPVGRFMSRFEVRDIATPDDYGEPTNSAFLHNPDQTA